MTRHGDRDRVITAAGIIAILIVGWLAYAPGMSGTFMFDDAPNIGKVQNVDDRESAIRFIFTGTAGPLGRPIALASFVPQADSWQDGAGPFLRVNVLLHLLNGLLVVLFLRMLAIASGRSLADAGKVALLAGAIWVLTPILASSSLVVIQRMTTLSATFVLLGLIGYLTARRHIDTRPKGALIGMSASLGMATTLAVLSKENGALLPTLVLVAEATLLTRPSTPRAFRLWGAVFLLAPTALIIAYLLYKSAYTPEFALMRDFTGPQRLLTEARILWEYLFRAFVPLPGQILPYQDGHPVARTLAEPLTLLATLSWIAALAFALRYRRTFAIPAFGILWFLAGHLLESTTLPLELAFDHRNYLPLIGPAFALACVPLALAQEYRGLAFASLTLYALFLGVSLYGVASRMGQPAENVADWYAASPTSVRSATSYIAQRIAGGDIDGAFAVMNEFVEQNPQHAYILIQELNFYCLIDAYGDQSERVASLMSRLSSVGYALSTGVMLRDLLSTASGIDCRSVSDGTVSAFATAVMQNPRYAANRFYTSFHHTLMANIYSGQGDVGAALRHLQDAEAAWPSMDIATMTVNSHVANNDTAAARRTIEAARGNVPWLPTRRYIWHRDLDELERFVDSVEADPTGSR